MKAATLFLAIVVVGLAQARERFVTVTSFEQVIAKVSSKAMPPSGTRTDYHEYTGPQRDKISAALQSFIEQGVMVKITGRVYGDPRSAKSKDAETTYTVTVIPRDRGLSSRHGALWKVAMRAEFAAGADGIDKLTDGDVVAVRGRLVSAGVGSVPNYGKRRVASGIRSDSQVKSDLDKEEDFARAVPLELEVEDASARVLAAIKTERE